jgi:flavin-dependent dehydrogenase
VEIDEDIRADAPFGGALSASRRILDAALLDRCRDVGAEVLTRSTFVDVIREHGRVVGVRARTSSGEVEVRGRVVVGADGRASQFAASVGARRYHVAPGERFIYWADYEGVDPGPSPAVWNVRAGRDQWLGFFSENRHFTLAVSPPMDEYPDFAADVVGNFERKVASCPHLSEVVRGGRRIGRPIGTGALDAYFREASGPGWVLVGDAGIFKDPVLGQGIADAFRQSDRLAAFLDGAVLTSTASVDRALAEFGRWRDRDAFEMYWLAVDAAAGVGLNELEAGVFDVIAEAPRLRYGFAVELPSHWAPPSSVLSIGTVMAGARRSRRRPARVPLGVLAGQLVDRLRRAVHRRRLRRAPRYVVAADPIARRAATEAIEPVRA